jgi:hypothetical protein
MKEKKSIKDIDTYRKQTSDAADNLMKVIKARRKK